MDILAFEMLPGGRQAVAMEYISAGVMIMHSPAPSLDTYKACWTNKFLGLIRAFYETDLFHSDLRDANILCDDDCGCVLLIDLDRGGAQCQTSITSSWKAGCLGI